MPVLVFRLSYSLVHLSRPTETPHASIRSKLSASASVLSLLTRSPRSQSHFKPKALCGHGTHSMGAIGLGARSLVSVMGYGL